MELSRDEFEALPPTLRRKCLSSSERLRYTQIYGARSQPFQTTPAPALASEPAIKRRQTASSSRHQSYFARGFLHPKQPHSRLKSVPAQHDPSTARPLSSGRHGTRPLTTNDISRDDALFFSRLPEKLQRGQFTSAERQLLVGRQDSPSSRTPTSLEERIARFTTKETVHTLSRGPANRSLPSLSSTCSGLSTPRSSSTDDLETLQTADDMNDSYVDSLRWVEGSEAGLAVDDYHFHLASVTKTLPEPSMYPLQTSAPRLVRRQRSYTNFSLKQDARVPERNQTQDAPRYRASMDAKVYRTPRQPLSIIPPVPSIRDRAFSQTVQKQSSVPQLAEDHDSDAKRLPSKADKRAKPFIRTAKDSNAPSPQTQWQSAGWQPPAEWWQPLPKKPVDSQNRKSSAPSTPMSATFPRPPPVLAVEPRRVSSSSAVPTAEHYLNPEARLKLRMFLASPEKFDETLRYGFPTLVSPATPTSPRISTSSRNSMPARPMRSRTVHNRVGDRSAQEASDPVGSSASSAKRAGRGPTHSHSLTFLRDETTPELSIDGSRDIKARTGYPPRYATLSHDHVDSLEADDADIEDEGEVMESPDELEPSSGINQRELEGEDYHDVHDYEAEDVSSPGLTATSPGLTESSVEFERELARERHETFDMGEREMTLRMTLTRPELRADDAALYPHTAHLVAPQTRFIGKGCGHKPAPGAPMHALSKEKLFEEESVPAKNKSGGFRRLFSKKW